MNAADPANLAEHIYRASKHSTNLDSSQQVRQIADVIRQLRFHCEGDAQRLVNPAKVVTGMAKAVSSPQILPLFGKPVPTSRH